MKEKVGFTEAICDWRASRMLSRAEAAEMVGVNERTVRLWENGSISLPHPLHQRALVANGMQREVFYTPKNG